MYFHCCERVIVDLPAAISAYYYGIERKFRRGISNELLKKYIKEYKEYFRGIVDPNNYECRNIINLYLKLLSTDIDEIYNNFRLSKRWFIRHKYNVENNLFIMLNAYLFDISYHENEDFKNIVRQCEYYKKVLDGLKSCTVMRPGVFGKTILKYLFNNYEEYIKEIESVII